MAHNRARIVVGLLTTFLWGFSPAAAEEPARQLRIEKEFPQTADYMRRVRLALDDERSGAPKLLRIALADNAVTGFGRGRHGRIPLDHTWEGAVWVSDNHSQTIYKIDPKTNLIVMRIPADFRISPEAGEIGVGEGAVWAITGGFNDVLRRYSAQTGVEQATIPLPSPAAPGVVVDFGSIWIAGSREVELYRLDPATNRIVATTDLHSHLVALASGEGRVGPPGRRHGSALMAAAAS
jgi:hypothetical protein